MKRKAEQSSTHDDPSSDRSKKPATHANGVSVSSRFGRNLFAPDTVQRYAKEYADSTPYKHAVVSNLIDDELLRSVRTEILDNIHFTPKETDIYKIHQSGDLANLDGLPESALQKLPSLLKLRDALYGSEFRKWLSTVTGAGLLSGKKTDMAVNVYVPGCHLLCHDDVIGSRRVSYILYLTHPDMPWQAEWGGALRLYPTKELPDETGQVYKVPSAEWSKVIPPAWNQLSFFAVQPGESFHDVEEVYHRSNGEDKNDEGRFRMAISGWFHIPQEGEEGFEPGLEESLAEKSSLQQLQGKAAQFDIPQPLWSEPNEAPQQAEDGETTVELTESDLEFLIQYITPNYLTPDTVEELNELFAEESMAQLSDFLNNKFADRLKAWFHEDHANANFKTSRPPHKYRYQFCNSQPKPLPSSLEFATGDPFDLILHDLLPSLAFRKWLSLVTGLTLQKSAIMARRFRRGLDYELAQAYEGEDPQLEYCLCVTPSTGWGGDDDGADDETPGGSTSKDKENGTGEEDNVGGYELYMAGEDDEDDDDDDDGSNHVVGIPAKMQSQTGAGDRRHASRKKADPAIYKAAGDDEGDDGILASNPASWNTLNLVLRDEGTLRFVKYVSQNAPGDRWDFTGQVEVEPEDEVGNDDE